MHNHKISNQKHVHFLKEERKDPITGDLIVEGDEVVFCAECKSAFLKSSWEYIGKRHCNTESTLSIFPQTKNIRIGKLLSSNIPPFILSEKNKDKLEQVKDIWKKQERSVSIFKNHQIIISDFNLNKNLIIKVLLIICFVVCLFSPSISKLSSKEQGIAFLIFSFSVVCLFIAFVLYQELSSKKTEITEKEIVKNSVMLFENDKLGIYLHDEKKYYYVNYREISQIKFYYPASVHLKNFFYKIKINTVDGKETSFELENKEGNKNHFLKQTEDITNLISSNSRNTLIIFKISLNKSIFYEINELKNIGGNIHLE
jgi:hypothetical protein